MNRIDSVIKLLVVSYVLSFNVRTDRFMDGMTGGSTWVYFIHRLPCVSLMAYCSFPYLLMFLCDMYSKSCTRTYNSNPLQTNKVWYHA